MKNTIAILMLLWFVFWVAVVIGGVYTAVHFILKLW